MGIAATTSCRCVREKKVQYHGVKRQCHYLHTRCEDGVGWEQKMVVDGGGREGEARRGSPGLLARVNFMLAYAHPRQEGSIGSIKPPRSTTAVRGVRVLFPLMPRFCFFLMEEQLGALYGVLHKIFNLPLRYPAGSRKKLGQYANNPVLLRTTHRDEVTRYTASEYCVLRTKVMITRTLLTPTPYSLHLLTP